MEGNEKELKQAIIKLKKQLVNVSKKLAEAEQKSQLLEHIIASMPGHIYWLDKEGRVLGCNDEQARDVGFSSRDDLVGKTLYDFQSKEEADQIVRNNKAIIESGSAKIVEEPGNLAQGNKKIYLSYKAPLKNIDGNTIGLIGLSLDITKHKKNEFTLENIIASLPGHIYWKDTHSNYLGCNNNFARTLNLVSRFDIANKTDFDFLSKDAAETIIHNDQEVMAVNQEEELEETGLSIDKKPATYLTKKIPVLDEDKNVVGILGISVDITERKRMEDELQQAKNNAETANRAKTEFIRNMEHDLRTPASGIYGLTTIMAENTNDNAQKENLLLISKASEELLNILNDILRFHQIESGGFPVLTKKLDIHSVVKRIIALESALAKNKNIDLQLDINKKMPKLIISDEFRIYRLLLNLVSNAIKFTRVGFVRLSVNLKKQVNDRNIILQFIVEDSGIGIPKERQNTIYEKFQKLALSNTGLYKGLGLGLRIVRQFVDELDGDIEVESEVDKGTKFTCTLPVKLPLIGEE